MPIASILFKVSKVLKTKIVIHLNLRLKIEIRKKNIMHCYLEMNVAHSNKKKHNSQTKCLIIRMFLFFILLSFIGVQANRVQYLKKSILAITNSHTKKHVITFGAGIISNSLPLTFTPLKA